MGSLKQKNRKIRKGRSKSRLQNYKRSVLAISSIIVMLSAVIVIHGMALQARNKEYMAQEAELMAQLDDEKDRSEEIDKLKEYVGTDEYIEDVAKEKLGLIKQNEILFKTGFFYKERESKWQINQNITLQLRLPTHPANRILETRMKSCLQMLSHVTREVRDTMSSSRPEQMNMDRR